jgi:succinate-semialdehyde dehydrogenase / glutarate-semialdehyde dehydrogenase
MLGHMTIRVCTTINPATGQALAEYAYASPKQIDQALATALRCQQAWQQRSLVQRAACLHAIAQQLELNKETYAIGITQEMGKPIMQARSEIDKCAAMCRFFATHAPDWSEDQACALPQGNQALIAYEPYGVVLAILPWNYPWSLAFRILATALMAGNAVLIKHAPNVQGCAKAIIDCVQQAGLPVGLVQHLCLTNDAVARVIADVRIHAVSFTGSRPVGAHIAGLAGQAIKKVVLELGGCDPYVVLADADLALVAKETVASRLNNSGQVCIAAKRLLCLPQHQEELTALLLQEMAAYVGSDPMDDQCLCGPMARSDLRDQVHQQVQQLIHQGAHCLLGGAFDSGVGYYYPATLLLATKQHHWLAQNEIFGPVLGLCVAENEAALVDLAKQTPFGLGAVIFSQDKQRAVQFAQANLDVGCCAVNQKVRSYVELPFGGRKQSGFGCELGLLGLRTWQQQKTVVF